MSNECSGCLYGFNEGVGGCWCDLDCPCCSCENYGCTGVDVFIDKRLLWVKLAKFLVGGYSNFRWLDKRIRGW